MRVGDEVRRPVRPNFEFVHEVLLALESAGLRGAPRLLGLDEQGLERLSYIDGWVAPDLAHEQWTDEQLIAAAQLIRGFHDALAGSALAGDDETVCHNDLGPCNTVHADGLPVAFIDWDTAAPGPRALDLAHGVWYWTVFSETEVLPLDEQVRRVRLMCDAYGDALDRQCIPDAILAAQQRTISKIADTLRRGDTDAGYWRRSLEWHRGEQAWFASHSQAFQRGLR